MEIHTVTLLKKKKRKENDRILSPEIKTKTKDNNKKNPRIFKIGSSSYGSIRK